jgi:hypothetical protein
MSAIHRALLGAAALSASLLLPLATQAQEFTYNLVLTAKLENGRTIDLPAFPISDLMHCLREKKKTEIGRKFPRGVIVTPDGKSPSGTIVAARCEERPTKMGG